MILNSDYYCWFSDEELFNHVKQDDKKAFEELFKRYWAFLLDNAYKPLQSREKAEDIVQEIFISLFIRRHTIELAVSLKAYLCQALKFKVMNEYRSQTVRRKFLKNLQTKDFFRNESGGNCERKELEMSINQSIKQLPDKCKRVFLLSREEEYSYKDISGALNISVSTVEKHISKALKVLKGQVNLMNN
jgi:RNA polymerase sigma-70 factor (ECF subfamily)